MNCRERYNQLVLMILRSLDIGPQYPFLIPASDAWLQKRELLKKLLTAPSYEMGNCATPSNSTPQAFVNSLLLVLFLNKRGFEGLFFSKTRFAQKEHRLLLMEKKQNYI